MRLVPIVPNEIAARSFLHRNDRNVDWTMQLKNTQAAEMRHQSMLADIASYLIEKGLTPFQSGSIDLLFEHLGTTHLVELKSATPENCYSQAAHGAFQLALYRQRLRESFSTLRSLLIIESTSDPVNSLLRDTLAEMDLVCLFYKKALPWPDRVSRLLF